MDLARDDTTLPAPPPLDLGGCALFLDLDGTLAEIAPHPDDVGPQPRRTRLLRALCQRLEGRLAVISGRSLADVDRILEGQVKAAAAVHGLVRRTAAGAVLTRPPHPALDAAREALDAFAARHPKILIEDKGLSLALHYRAAPQARDAALDLARNLAGTSGLVLQLGRMVAELRTPGADKGGSVTAFMAEAPFAGRAPVFVGDDLTDEDGFAAAEALGGFGVLAGPKRASAAHYRLAGVDEVLRWLEAAVSEGR